MVQSRMRFSQTLGLILVAGVLALSASAQEAAAPELGNRAASVAAANPLIRPATLDAPAPHKFFDRQQLLALYVHSGMRLADTIKTCRSLAHGGVEDWIPTQSCGVVAAWQAGSIGLALGAGWLFHKHGNHRLERLTPWIGTGASAAGLTKSIFNIR